MLSAVAPSPCGQSRREQKRRTKKRLFEAACRLLANDGYHRTSVAAIAREAGVAKGTFFVHFATKEALITELVDSQVRQTRAARERVLARGGTPIEALRATVESLGKVAAQSQKLTRAVLSASLESPKVASDARALFAEVTRSMRADAAAAIERRQLSSDFDPSTVASTLMASYLGAALTFGAMTDAEPIESALARFVDVNLSGFGAKGATHAHR